MMTSNAIPLAIYGQHTIDLITWFYLGFEDGSKTGPSCILILTSDTEVDRRVGSKLIFETHICNFEVLIEASRNVLTFDEGKAIATALITAASRFNSDSLIPIFAELTSSFDSIISDSALRVRSVIAGNQLTFLDWINFVPQCVVARTLNGYQCFAVKKITFEMRKMISNAEIQLKMSDVMLHQGFIVVGGGTFIAAIPSRNM
ncbi:hypothetical protein [Methylobacterium radiotolerans]|nr:hypothetical protein [Methylobacterium radiotolerans]